MKMNKEPSSFKYCFVCVCQKGELEIQSLLLLASLKRYLRVDYELVAAIPTPVNVWGAPDKDTLRQLKTWGVKIHPVINSIGADYPIANKLGCLSVATGADRIIFLDSDMLCIAPFVDDPIFRHRLCARAASLPFKGEDEGNWKNIYNLIGDTCPEKKMLSAVSREKMLPYFNAGFLAVDPDLNFSTAWIDLCLIVDSSDNVTYKRPYLDQIALPLAANELGIECQEIDVKYNFPPRLRETAAFKTAIFYHYNNPQVALNAPKVISMIQNIAKRFPVIKNKIRADSTWKILLEKTSRK